MYSLQRRWIRNTSIYISATQLRCYEKKGLLHLLWTFWCMSKVLRFAFRISSRTASAFSTFSRSMYPEQRRQHTSPSSYTLTKELVALAYLILFTCQRHNCLTRWRPERLPGKEPSGFCTITNSCQPTQINTPCDAQKNSWIWETLLYKMVTM